MTQGELSFPDPEEGARRRDEAIERVGENAGELWREKAWQALKDTLELGTAFSSEHLRKLLTDRGDWPPPNDPRALGAVMTRARKEGLIVPAGWGKSIYASSHRMNKQLWRPA